MPRSGEQLPAIEFCQNYHQSQTEEIILFRPHHQLQVHKPATATLWTRPHTQVIRRHFKSTTTGTVSYFVANSDQSQQMKALSFALSTAFAFLSHSTVPFFLNVAIFVLLHRQMEILRPLNIRWVECFSNLITLILLHLTVLEIIISCKLAVLMVSHCEYN